MKTPSEQPCAKTNQLPQELEPILWPQKHSSVDGLLTACLTVKARAVWADHHTLSDLRKRLEDLNKVVLVAIDKTKPPTKEQKSGQ